MGFFCLFVVGGFAIFLFVLVRKKKMLGASEENISFADNLSKRVKNKAWLWLRRDYLKKIFLL